MIFVLRKKGKEIMKKIRSYENRVRKEEKIYGGQKVQRNLISTFYIIFSKYKNRLKRR
jgi:hypothetical protein